MNDISFTEVIDPKLMNKKKDEPRLEKHFQKRTQTKDLYERLLAISTDLLL